MKAIRPPYLLLAAAVFAHLFVLWLHTLRMLGTEHYSFFPLGLLGALIIWNQRREEIANQASRSSSVVSALLLGGSVVTASMSSLLASGFAGWLSLTLFLTGFLFAFFGAKGLIKSIPIIVMLLVITPLPALLDRKLVLNMQYLASVIASRGLDVFGVANVRQGVVIVAPSQSFLAEEACSGIRSLFSTMAGIVFWGLLHRYSALRHSLNLLQAFCWVIIFNAARIITVVLVEEWTTDSIAEGWKHDLLGFLTFFCIGGIVLSTDRLFSAFVPPKKDLQSSQLRPVTKKLLFPSQNGPSLWTISPIIVAFILVGFLGLRLWSLEPSQAMITGSLPDVEASALPDKIDAWTVVSFRHVNRSRGDLQGEKSFVWELENERRKITVSVDGDWADYHDLGECYSGLGWIVRRDFQYPSLSELAAGTKVDSVPSFTIMKMNRLTEEQCFGIFSSIDSKGHIVLRPTYIGNDTALYVREKMVNQLREAIGFSKNPLLRETTITPPVSTLQVIYVPTNPITEIEQNDLQRLFLKVRNLLKLHPRFGGRGLTE